MSRWVMMLSGDQAVLKVPLFLWGFKWVGLLINLYQSASLIVFAPWLWQWNCLISLVSLASFSGQSHTYIHVYMNWGWWCITNRYCEKEKVRNVLPFAGLETPLYPKMHIKYFLSISPSPLQLMADWLEVMQVWCWLREEAPTHWLTCASSTVSPPFIVYGR